jgi:hypothetical protein
MANEIPRPFFKHDEPVFQTGKKLSPKAKGGIALLAQELSTKDVHELRTLIDGHGANTVVVVGSKAPLSVLQHAAGVPFVVLEGGRRSFEGLGALPNSVRRLSIRTHTKPISFAELPRDTNVEQLVLDLPAVSEFAALPRLRSLGWTKMSDDGAPFVAAQPGLQELALQNTTATTLPASKLLERLILLSPSKLGSLAGLAGLPNLRFLRVDSPKGMARLGSLADAPLLETVVLVSAHLIPDLSGLATAAVSLSLGVIQTKLDEQPFLILKGKVSSASLQLKTPAANKKLLEFLNVPSQKINLIENHFFDNA